MDDVLVDVRDLVRLKAVRYFFNPLTVARVNLAQPVLADRVAPDHDLGSIDTARFQRIPAH